MWELKFPCLHLSKFKSHSSAGHCLAQRLHLSLPPSFSSLRGNPNTEPEAPLPSFSHSLGACVRYDDEELHAAEGLQEAQPVEGEYSSSRSELLALRSECVSSQGQAEVSASSKTAFIQSSEEEVYYRGY